MRERKLPISLEGLWDNPNQLFTVRYKDINERNQKILAQRIKTTAKQRSLRRENGPTVEKIEEVLDEINPVIFSEMQRRIDWYRGHQVFGISPAVYIAGYRYEALCQAVYLLTCRKKSLNIAQITRIARLTFEDREVVTQYVESRLGLLDEEGERVTPIEEIGIDDIARARERAEQTTGRLSNDLITPDENYDAPAEERNPLVEAMERIDNIISFGGDGRVINRQRNVLGGTRRIGTIDETEAVRRRDRERHASPAMLDIEIDSQPPALRTWQQRYIPDASRSREDPGHSFLDEYPDSDDEDEDTIEELSGVERIEIPPIRDTYRPWEPPLPPPGTRFRIGLDQGI